MPSNADNDAHSNLEVYNELWQEFTRIDALRLMFKALYSDDTVAGLNRHAPWVFAEIQRALGNMLLLQIVRLADEDSKALTFRKLFQRLCLRAGDLRSRLEQQLNDFDAACKDIRTHRDKSIAHNELKVALGSKQLPRLLNQDITAALRAMQPLIESFNEALGTTLSPSIEVENDESVRQAQRLARHFVALEKLIP